MTHSQHRATERRPRRPLLARLLGNAVRSTAVLLTLVGSQTVDTASAADARRYWNPNPRPLVKAPFPGLRPDQVGAGYLHALWDTDRHMVHMSFSSEPSDPFRFASGYTAPSWLPVITRRHNGHLMSLWERGLAVASRDTFEEYGLLDFDGVQQPRDRDAIEGAGGLMLAPGQTPVVHFKSLFFNGQYEGEPGYMDTEGARGRGGHLPLRLREPFSQALADATGWVLKVPAFADPSGEAEAAPPKLVFPSSMRHVGPSPRGPLALASAAGWGTTDPQPRPDSSAPPPTTHAGAATPGLWRARLRGALDGGGRSLLTSTLLPDGVSDVVDLAVDNRHLLPMVGAYARYFGAQTVAFGARVAAVGVSGVGAAAGAAAAGVGVAGYGVYRAYQLTPGVGPAPEDGYHTGYWANFRQLYLSGWGR